MRRDIILDVIQKIPGINFNEIVRRTNLSNGVVSHHILQLLKENKIVKSKSSRAKYFHHSIPKEDMEFIIILRNKTNYDIIEFLLRTEFPVTPDAIRKKIKKSRTTISTNLKKLEKAKLIGRQILNRNSKLTSDIGFYLLDEEFVQEIFSRYKMQ